MTSRPARRESISDEVVWRKFGVWLLALGSRLFFFWWRVAERIDHVVFSSRRRHSGCSRDWSSDVCSSDLLPALLSLADALLRENHEAEALPYATRAVEVEPTSWRAHVILANVYLRQGSADAAVKEAERAMELGHEQAAMVQPVLAGALARKGEKEPAVAILQKYLKEHPLDDQAKKLQEGFERIATSDGRSAASSPPPEELAL